MDESYVAGLFDGDGTISNPKKRTVSLSISQINKPLLEEIKSFLGYGVIETVYNEYEDKHGYKHRTLYRIRFNRDDAIKLLNSIIPHLILKKERGIKALTVLQECVGKTQKTGIPKGTRTYNAAIYFRLYRLHKKGLFPLLNPIREKQKCSI